MGQDVRQGQALAGIALAAAGTHVQDPHTRSIGSSDDLGATLGALAW